MQGIFDPTINYINMFDVNFVHYLPTCIVRTCFFKPPLKSNGILLILPKSKITLVGISIFKCLVLHGIYCGN